MRTRPLVGAISPILLAQRFHRNAVADDHAFGAQLFLQVDVLMPKFFRFDCVLNQDQRLVDGEWLFQKIKSPNFVARTAVSMVPCPES